MRCVFREIGVAMLVCAAAGAMAMTYYVSADGSDQNDGKSQAKAWKTLAKVSSSSFAAGDTVCLNAASTFTGTLGLGVNHAGITVTSYGMGRATINAGSGKGIAIYNVAGVTVRDVIIRGGWNASTQTGNTGTGIEAHSDRVGQGRLQGLTIQNVEAYGFKRGGIVISAYPANGEKVGWENVLVEDCDAHDNGAVGIESYGPFDQSSTRYTHKNITVRRCKTWNNRGVTNSGSHSGSGIILADVQVALIERCVAYNNGEKNDHPGGGPVGIWCWDADQVVIQLCEAYDNKTGTGDGGGFDLDGGVTNSILQYNYSHGNDGAGYLVCQFTGGRPFHSNTVRYNVSENDGRKNGYGGIVLFDGEGDLADCEIYNNTCFVSPSGSGTPTACRLLGTTKNIRIRNNVFVTTSGLPLVDVTGSQPGLIFQGNSYWGSGGAFLFQWQDTTFTSLSAWRSATNQEKLLGQPTGFDIDPQVANLGQGGTLGDALNLENLAAYRLKKSSPLIGKAIDLKAVFGITIGTRDFFGGIVPSQKKADVGAHEFQPTSVPVKQS